MNDRCPTRRVRIGAAVCLSVLAASGCARVGESASRAGGCSVVWSPHTRPGYQVNLGATGAQGWVDGSRIHVTHVAPSSPADGVLRKGDVLVGAGGAAFREGADPREAIAKAIGAGEAAGKGGRLTLTVIRGGAKQALAVRLRVMGSYSPTWPRACGKSERILDDACRWLARRQYPDGHLQGEEGMPTTWSGLLFLASGDARYLDNARRAAYWLVDQKLGTRNVPLSSWPRSYTGIFLAEYYLATGDAAVIGELKSLADTLAKGQMQCGSWGHNCPWDGYGAVNQVGLTCLLALALTRECGIRVDDAAVGKATMFFRKYAGKGWIPYGDHVPWLGASGNGKNAIAAVAFDVLGKGKLARDFALPVAHSYAHREDGHTGAYFSFLWGPLGAVHAGREKLRTFLDHQKWYYDLARTHDGALVCQPNPENLSGRTPGLYTRVGPVFTTGGMGLLYAMPLRKLRILGAEPGVFGRKLTGQAAKAQTLLRHKKWKELDAHLAAWAGGKGTTDADKRLLAQFRDALERQRRSVDLTLANFRWLIEEGDVYRASELLRSLERLLGTESSALDAARKTMAANEQWVADGRKYYQAWSNLRDFTWQFWHYYGKRAAATLGDVRPPAPARWQTLAATSEESPQTWKVLQWGDARSEPTGPDAMPQALKDWQREGFDDSKWAASPGPMQARKGAAAPWKTRHVLLRRPFTLDGAAPASLRLRVLAERDSFTRVYLNGTLVAEIVRGEPRRYAVVPLSAKAAGLLRKGPNLLAVHGRRDGPRRSLDVGLEGVRP